MAETRREETYQLPEGQGAATAFVNSLQRKGYTVKHLTTSHVVVLVPVEQKDENNPPKKQVLND